MGTAFIAVADDPSAILHNPAGLVDVRGTQVYGGVVTLSPSTRYRGPAGEADTEPRLFWPPHLFLTTDFGTERFAFGLGLFSPFGIGGRTWDAAGPLRHLSTESTVGTLTVNPAVAWRIGPTLALAAGADLMQSRMEARRKLDQSLVGAPDAEVALEASGEGWGYNLGLLWTPRAGLRLGLAYRSGIDIDHEGDLVLEDIAPALEPLFEGKRFSSPLVSPSSFPEVVGAGIACMPVPGLTAALDVEVVRWSSFDRGELRLEREVAAAGIRSVVTELGWRDSWQVKAGLEYRTAGHWRLRAGYAYVPSPVPERTLAPDNPDADQHNLSVGLGFARGRIVADAFYNAGLFERRKVENDILPGSYESIIHYLGLSLGCRL